nr:hypothetical protein [Tanacetum cinerariifolium]
EAGFTSFGTSVGGGNHLEDKDSDFYDGYEDQVFDLHCAIKEYRDFMLSMSGVTKIVLLRFESVPLTSRFVGFLGVSVTKLATGRLIDESSCDGIDVVIKDLDLETKIDAMMREFLEQVLKTSPCFR